MLQLASSSRPPHQLSSAFHTTPLSSYKRLCIFTALPASSSQYNVQDTLDTRKTIIIISSNQTLWSKEAHPHELNSLPATFPPYSQELPECASSGQIGVANDGSSHARSSIANTSSKSGIEELEEEPPIIEEPFEPITKINVSRQKYIPVSKASLVKALADSFHDDTKASEFRMICSLLDFILHAEHKTTLEQMRLDYRITRSALKKQAQHAKGKTIRGRKVRKRKGWVRKVLDFWSKRRDKNKVARMISASMKQQLRNLTLDQVEKVSSNGSIYSSYDEGKEEGRTNTSGSHSSHSGTSTRTTSVVSSDGTERYSSHSGTSTRTTSVVSSDGTERNSIAAAARFQHNFLKLLRNAHFQGLSTRDLQLTSALNTDYLLTLPIEVDWKHISSKVAIIFRRGYASERQEGFLFGAKLDFIQSVFLLKIFNWFSRPLFRAGRWMNQQLKYSKESDGSRSWAEEIAEWLKEPLKPESDDDLSGIITDSLTDEEKEDYLPIWKAAQQAVPRYEAFLSSVGSRGMLLRKILVWMRILPSCAANLLFNPNSDANPLVSNERGKTLARVSMRDIWLPASKVVCGNDIWRQLQAAFSIFFSRSTLQEPAYRELVLLYNVPNSTEEEANDDIPNLQLKIYGKIPIPDLKVIFPNKKLSFRILDTVRLDVATIIGLLAFLINYRFDDVLRSPSAFLLDIVASSALIVYVTRVVLGYKQTFDRYQLLVNKTLYEKTLASGFGAAHFLVDASQQQQFKECVLAYALLMQGTRSKVESRESLATRCEDFLINQFKEQVEMPIDDALANLLRLGLVSEKACPSTMNSNGAKGSHCYDALPYAESMTVLRDRWSELLSDGSMPTAFLCALYQTSID